MSQEQQKPFLSSDLYEYTLHENTDNTLQVFSMHTLRSTSFSATQTLALLNFLAEHRCDIETLAQAQQAQPTRTKTTEVRIDDLFS